MSGHVYFVQSEPPDGPIKIGYSANVAGRVAAFRTTMPNGYELLLSIPGTKETEAELHRQFAPHRRAGEWFSPVSDLLGLISALREHGIEELHRRGIPCEIEAAEIPSFPEFDHQSLAQFLSEQFPAKTAYSVAQECGLKKANVESWMRGKAAPQAKQLGALMDRFGPDVLAAAFPALSEVAWVKGAKHSVERERLRLESIEVIDELIAAHEENIRASQQKIAELQKDRALAAEARLKKLKGERP